MEDHEADQRGRPPVQRWIRRAAGGRDAGQQTGGKQRLQQQQAPWRRCRKTLQGYRPDCAIAAAGSWRRRRSAWRLPPRRQPRSGRRGAALAMEPSLPVRLAAVTKSAVRAWCRSDSASPVAGKTVFKAALIMGRIIGEMAMGLAEGRHDLRHFQAELAIGVGECRAVAAFIALVALGGVGPDLDAAVRPTARRRRRGAARCRSSRKPPPANAFDDRRAGAVDCWRRPAWWAWQRGFGRGRA